MGHKESKSNKQTNLALEQKSRSICSCADPEGGTEGPDPPPPPPPPPPENHKNIGFPSITCLDLLKITKPAFNVGHYLHASEMPFQTPIIAHLWWFLGPRSP